MLEVMLVIIINGQKVVQKVGIIPMSFHIFKEWKQAMEAIQSLEENQVL